MNSIFTRAAYGAFRFCKKHSTVILAVAATAGLGATVYTSIKAYQNIEDDVRNAGNIDNKKLGKIILKDSIVPICLGLATVSCIAGETIIDIKKEKSLTATIALVQGGFQRYREGLIELHGKEADNEVMEFISARGGYEYHYSGDVGPDQKVWWVDPISNQKILSYERQVLDGEYHFQRNFIMRGYADLNEFLTFVGMKPVEGCENLGWSSSDGYYWVDVEHTRIGEDENGIPIMRFDFIFSPDESYMEDWL